MSKMVIVPDLGVCTLSWIRGFGGSRALGNSRETGYSNDAPCADSFEDFIYQLHEQIGVFAGNNTYGIDDRAIIGAYTVSGQPDAEKYLAQLGFVGVHSGEFPKYKHTCTMWSMPSPEFYKKVKALHKEFEAKKAKK